MKKKKRIIIIGILILLVLPIAYRFLEMGLDSYESNQLIKEDERQYGIGDSIENKEVRITIDKVLVTKSPEDILEPYKNYQNMGNEITYNDLHEEPILIDMDDEGNLKNDVSYLKVYFTIEVLSEQQTIKMGFDSALMDGNQPTTSYQLYSDRISGEHVDYNQHNFSKEEKQTLVTSYIAYDKDLKNAKDLNIILNPPRDTTELEPVDRHIHFDKEKIEWQ